MTEILKSANYDLRMLASSLVGSLEMLRDTSLTINQRGMLDQALESAGGMLDLVNITIDYDSIKDGTFKFNLSDFDLVNLVEQTAESLSPLARANKASLMTYVSPEVPLRLRGDSQRLRQILTFLISKALNRAPTSELILKVTPERETRPASKASGANTVALTFTLEQKTQTAGALPARLASQDDLTDLVIGEIVRQMSGELTTHADQDQTAMFWFNALFEVMQQPRPEQEASASQAGADDSFLLSAKALIVDDSKANRDVLYYYMRSWGLSISQDDCVASAAEALKALRRANKDKQPYDVALLDLAMPEMDGLELGRSIRNDPDIANTPLVLLTAFDYEIHRDEAQPIGFSAFLTKPVRQSQLLDAIASAVYERHLPDQTMLPPANPIPQPFISAPSNGRRILIAEDNLANQKLALAQLDRLGYTARAVSSGSKAIEEYQANSADYSLILMDCQMPEVDGFAATRAIRQQEALRGGHIPIIAMTATVTRGAREMCISAGMDDYLSKPVSRDALHNMLMRWVDG